MVFEGLNSLRLSTAENLAKVIMDSEIFYFDGWSFVHFLSGVFLMFLLVQIFNPKSDRRKLFLILFIILVIYEIFEWILYTSPLMWINPEDVKDVTWDLILGLFGGLLYLRGLRG